jgi:hypothetical protein
MLLLGSACVFEVLRSDTTAFVTHLTVLQMTDTGACHQSQGPVCVALTMLLL